MPSQPANTTGVKSTRVAAMNGLRSSAWTQSLSAAAMMLLAEQALSKMHERGLTPESVLNSLALAVAPQGVQVSADSAVSAVSAESQALAVPAQGSGDNAELSALRELLGEIARDALSLQDGNVSQADASAELMAPVFLQSMGLNYELIQEASQGV